MRGDILQLMTPIHAVEVYGVRGGNNNGVRKSSRRTAVTVVGSTKASVR